MTIAEMTALFESDHRVVSVQTSFEFGGCDRGVITDASEIIDLVDLLIEKINMRAFGKPLRKSHHFGHGRLAGSTLVQLIETSDIVVHGWDEYVGVTLTLDSCKPYDVPTVLGFLIEAFGAESWSRPDVHCRRIPTKEDQS